MLLFVKREKFVPPLLFCQPRAGGQIASVGIAAPGCPSKPEAPPTLSPSSLKSP